MKRLLSVLLTFALCLSLVSIPTLAFADNTTTSPAVKVNNGNVDKAKKNLERALQKAQTDLQKALKNRDNINVSIQKAIDKAKADAAKKLGTVSKKQESAANLEEKWQAELNKADAQDKLELEHLNADIAKWTEIRQKEEAALNQRLADIDSNLNKQLTELDKKIASAKDDAAKQQLLAAKTSLQNYATLRKDAIKKYLTSIQSLWADRQKVWELRRSLLTSRQAMDKDFRTTMNNIKTAELKDSLTKLTQTQPTANDAIEAAVKAKFQKTLDAVNVRIQKLQAQITDLQNKLK